MPLPCSTFISTFSLFNIRSFSAEIISTPMKVFGAVLVFLAYFGHATSACPALCQCYPRRAEVVCNEVPLTVFPVESLPENTSTLTIQFTNITSISEQDLNATPRLKQLHLFSNHLNNLSSHLLRGVPLLTTLDLTGNKLSHLPAEVFSHAPLQILVLKNNLVEKADAAWLPDNSDLTWLDVSGNHLTNISGDFLQKMPHLENLDLSNNHLVKILANSLDPLIKLDRLNLQNNKLDSLDASLFESTRNLTYLFLSRNRLTYLPPNIFQKLTQLKHLSLDDNQLSSVPPGLLDHLNALEDEGLDLTANPWVCDGKMAYLLKWLQNNQKKAFLPETMICSGPQSLKGRSVMSLTETELKI
ncbi:leucine-rich alpha-2-glycoprotein-like isoform X1 [Hippocampus comes]|uniref:leucine-rich alpha-2-glycoprotein-like isoform X1 n=2 Tax=Hippocampus comes TaxID=109280 RepID=UPI00094E25D6|nr:PREDICTED: leucine-rich alpha-2-glycoprotein-like isoform X1 [Hippocampus comes]